MTKPQVAISGCLLGERVRYDGNHKRSDFVADVLKPHIEPLSICPETGMGMKVPRPPIELITSRTGIELRMVDEPHTEYTHKMQSYVNKLAGAHSQLSGIISKSASPSCGVHDTPIRNDRTGTIDYGAGYYIRLMQESYPHIPIIDQKDIEMDDYRHRYLVHVFTLHRFYQRLRQHGLEGLRSFHFEHRTLLLSLDIEATKQLQLALEQVINKKATQFDYLKLLSRILQRPFSANRALKMLEHIAANQNDIHRSALRLLSKSMKATQQDQWISALFFENLNNLITQFNLGEVINKPFFTPYPVELMVTTEKKNKQKFARKASELKLVEKED
ncbi:MAG: DUF523 domain-containing protein [Kangiellaceae bacterium]|jgi:uncharacterized protein YbbK (DUF523 family)|nr:DUF523 domain-containing protein [Kangiellaceae bacterium]